MVKQKKEHDIMESRRHRAQSATKIKSKSKQSKPKHSVLKKLVLLVLLIVIVSIALLTKVYYDVKNVANKSYQPITRQTTAQLPNLKDKSPVTFLFMGLNGKVANDILVLTMNPKQNKTTVINLNRDIFLTSEGTTLKELYGSKGVSGEIDAVQTLLGTKISRYMTFDLVGLGDFVEAVGGINVQNTIHFNSDGFEFKPGTLNLKKSDEVKAYLNKIGNDAMNAEDMLIEREQSVLIAVVPKMKSVNTVLKYKTFLNAFGNHVKTDFLFDNLKQLGISYNGVLGNISKQNVKTIKVTIDGQERKMISEEQVKKAHDKLEAALIE